MKASGIITPILQPCVNQEVPGSILRPPTNGGLAALPPSTSNNLHEAIMSPFAFEVLLLLGMSITVIIGGCNKPSSQAGVETPLAMEDSAQAHSDRIRKAFETGDSAAYMAEYAADFIALSDGEILGGREPMARVVGDAFRSVKGWKANFSEEHHQAVGLRAAVSSLKFRLTGIDSAGKPITLEGVWSGVLGVRNGRTVVLQQHPSHPRSSSR